MRRTISNPRTGKRSKKQKKMRKNQPKEEEPQAMDKMVMQSSTESGAKRKEGDSIETKEMEEEGERADTSATEPNCGEEASGSGKDDDGGEETPSEREGQEEEEEEGEGEQGEEGEESDEPPEDISLSEGKVKALEQQKDEGQQIKRVKASVKRKRKEKYELFKKQKEAKQLRKVTKFSEEGLEKVARKMAEERANKKAEKKRKKRQKEARESREVQPDEVELKVGGVRVIPLCDEESAKETIMLRTASGYETAAQFLKQCLYGDRHKRIPALSLQAKRYRNQPAKNFAKTQMTKIT